MNSSTSKRRKLDLTPNNVNERIKKETHKLYHNKEQELRKKENAIVKLKSKLSKLSGRTCIRESKSIYHKIGKLESEIEYIQNDKHIMEFSERITPLLNLQVNNTTLEQHQKNIHFTNLFFQDSIAPSFVEINKCNKCATTMSFFTQDHTLMCDKCGNTEYETRLGWDIMEQDPFSKHTYNRTPLYRKYLEQFRDDTINPPDHVFQVVINELSKTQMMVSSKVRPTPVTQILRKYGLQKWCFMAVRITKTINKEPIITIPRALIDRLVNRFKEISTLFANYSVQRKKILNFEYLTKQFLLMENEHELSESYHLHKTKDVLAAADHSLYKYCKQLSATSTMKWIPVRSC